MATQLRFLAALAVVSLSFAACAGDESPDAAEQPAEAPESENRGGETQTETAVGTEGESEEPSEPTVVRIHGNGVTSDIGMFLAQERGYFEAVGVDMEFNQIRSAGDIIPLIADGQTDVYGSAFGAGLLNAIAGGVGIEVVADKGQLTDGSEPSYGMMLVHKDFADEITGPEDFAGKSIAWGDPASASTMMLEQYLSPAGLTLDDVRLVKLSMPERIVALEEGAVQLANVFEPTGTQALREGYAEVLFDLAEVVPNQQQAVLAYSSDWARANEEAARGFVSAYVCGIEDYHEILAQGGEEVDEMWAILEEARGAYPEGLLKEAVPPYLSPDGYPSIEDIQTQIEWYHDNGFTEVKLPVEDVVNTDYLDNRIPCDEIRGR